MAISPKTGLFRISRKLHFRGCNHGKQHASLPHGEGTRALLQGEECWEGSSKQNPRLFLFCCPVTKSCLTLCYPRLPCPSLSPGVCSHSCQRCHPTISSSVIPFSSCFQSFPASGSFLMSQLFASGGQSIGASAAASALPMNIYD